MSTPRKRERVADTETSSAAVRPARTRTRDSGESADRGEGGARRRTAEAQTTGTRQGGGRDQGGKGSGGRGTGSGAKQPKDDRQQRGKTSGGKQQQGAKQQHGKQQGGKGSGNRNQGSKNKRRNRGRRRSQQRGGASFWGDVSKLPTADLQVRITDDPSAIPRSLGAPPLPGHEVIAEHYFSAVYDRAVTTAGALAAAGGLIDPEALSDDDG